MEVASIYEFSSSLPLEKSKQNITEYLTPKVS